jgi:hypothetical protein
MAFVTSAVSANGRPGRPDSKHPSPGPVVQPVGHFGLVQVGDAERLEQLEVQIGDLRLRDPAGLLERLDGGGHLARERLKLGPQDEHLRVVDRRQR